MRRENTASNPWELDIGAVDDDEWSWFGGRLDGGKKKELLVPAVKVGSGARPTSLCNCFWRQWALKPGLTFHPDLTILLHYYGRRDYNAALPLPRLLRLYEKYFADTPVRVKLHFTVSKSNRLPQNDPQRVNANATNTKLVSAQRWGT